MGTEIFCAFFIICSFSLTKAKTVFDAESLKHYPVYPVKYDLNIYPYVFKENPYYDISLTVTVVAKVADVNVIEMDAKDLEIGAVEVLDGSRNIVLGNHSFEYLNDYRGNLYIYLKEPLKMYHENNRQFYSIKMSIRKHVKEDSNSGVFLAKYYDDQSKDYKYLFTTRLSPNKAKHFFPCFDNPRIESVFKFNVYTPKNLQKNQQYTNTSLVIAEKERRQRDKDNYTEMEFKPSPQISLYQVGFHHSRFTSSYAKAYNTNDTLILWAPISELHDYKFIHNYGITIINLIHVYSKDNRPLVQGPINLIPVPAIIGGYEIGSWNLLTNGAYRIINLDQFTSIKQIEYMTFELAQQLSRIWLGNPGELERTLWKEEWFKEGMATYFAYYFMTQYHHDIQIPHRRSLAGYGIQMKHKAMAVDWHKSTPALESFKSSLAIEIPSKYKELVTMKTGAIMWMVENWVESERFHQALVQYIKSRRGKYISLQDFTTVLDDYTTESLQNFFNGSTASHILGSWFKKPGYPVITVQVLRGQTPNAIQLTQRQFSFTPDNREVSDFLIPISYVVQHNQNCGNCHRPRFTIGAQTYTFKENLKNGWIILNGLGSGYYRVNYDAVTWRLIAKTLKENMQSIDELNRAQIVNDVFALYVAGDLDIQLAMEILDYLDEEPSPVVWDSVVAGYELLQIEGASCNMTKYLYSEWEQFMVKKISLIYTQLIKTRDNQLLTRLFRSNVVELACSLNYEPCHAHVKKMYVLDAVTERGKYNLFPDCRMSYFLYMASKTAANSYSWKLNSIEEDEKLIADKKIREKSRFFSKIPLGEARPMPIIMSTTEKFKNQLPPVSDNQPGSEGSIFVFRMFPLDACEFIDDWQAIVAKPEKLQTGGGLTVTSSLIVLLITVFINLFTV